MNSVFVASALQAIRSLLVKRMNSIFDSSQRQTPQKKCGFVVPLPSRL